MTYADLMMDRTRLREQCLALETRLSQQPAWAELNQIYLDMAPIIGQLQAAVSRYVRETGEESAREAQLALERLKAGSRRVGVDIRLASPAALAIGLQTVLESAVETLNRLEASAP